MGIGAAHYHDAAKLFHLALTVLRQHRSPILTGARQHQSALSRVVYVRSLLGLARCATQRVYVDSVTAKQTDGTQPKADSEIEKGQAKFEMKYEKKSKAVAEDTIDAAGDGDGSGSGGSSGDDGDDADVKRKGFRSVGAESAMLERLQGLSQAESYVKTLLSHTHTQLHVVATEAADHSHSAGALSFMGWIQLLRWRHCSVLPPTAFSKVRAQLAAYTSELKVDLSKESLHQQYSNVELAGVNRWELLQRLLLQAVWWLQRAIDSEIVPAMTAIHHYRLGRVYWTLDGV